MTSTAHSNHLPALAEPHQRAEVGGELQALIDSWRELADTVAERAVAIGVSPDGESATVTKESPLREVDRGELEDHVVVRELTSPLAEVAERARERMDRLGDVDVASQDVMIEVVRALEKQLWMTRAQFADQGRH